MRTRNSLLTLLLSIGLTGLVWVNHSQAATGPANASYANVSYPNTSNSDTSALTESAALLANDSSWEYLGVVDGDKFGYAVHTAGDVNNDGYDEVIIGAPLYTHEVYKEGAAFVFQGGPTGLGSAPDWVVGGVVQGVNFGAAVGTAGYVNGDGYDDVIIGADEYKVVFDVSGEPKSGAVFVYHGSETGLSATPDWSILAEAREIHLGRAVSTAGDVDNDGYDDVIVSAPYFESEDNSHTNEGKVYLYLGGPDGLADNPAWSYECNRTGALCGASLDAAGDVNNDGYDDVVLGAPNCDALIEDEGCAMVFFGCEEGLSLTANWTLDGDQEGATFGQSVAGAGDVDNDGFDDILVGAPLYTQAAETPEVGAAFGFYGSSTGPSTSPDWASYGEESYSRYGHALHTAGDVDDDGYSDVIVGAFRMGDNGDEDHQPDEGGVYLFTGSPDGLETTASWSAFGGKADALFGHSVGTAGNVDEDPADDLIVGSPDFKFDESTLVGKAFAFYNPDTGPRHSIYLPLIVVISGE